MENAKLDPVDFCYWLQGYVELSGQVPTPEQWEMIKEHLSLVFNKVTSTPDENKSTKIFNKTQEILDRLKKNGETGKLDISEDETNELFNQMFNINPSNQKYCSNSKIC